MKSTLRIFRCAVAVLLLCGSGMALGETSVSIVRTPKQPVRAGHFLLQWKPVDAVSGADGLHYVVEQALSDRFNEPREIYRGPDRSTFISGLPNGNFFYRVKSTDGNWSEPLEVTVDHYSVTLALCLFAIGLLSFGAIVGVIWHGNRQAT